MFETCNNRKEKKLFGVRTKLTYYKVFHRKTVAKRNCLNGYSNEKTSSTVNIPVHLALSISNLNRTVMYEFW